VTRIRRFHTQRDRKVCFPHPRRTQQDHVFAALHERQPGKLTHHPTIDPAKWHLNRSQFGITVDHDLASISDRDLASWSITVWHASDH
jgi:hypothetical protein